MSDSDEIGDGESYYPDLDTKSCHSSESESYDSADSKSQEHALTQQYTDAISTESSDEEEEDKTGERKTQLSASSITQNNISDDAQTSEDSDRSDSSDGEVCLPTSQDDEEFEYTFDSSANKYSKSFVNPDDKSANFDNSDSDTSSHSSKLKENSYSSSDNELVQYISDKFDKSSFKRCNKQNQDSSSDNELNGTDESNDENDQDDTIMKSNRSDCMHLKKNYFMQKNLQNEVKISNCSKSDDKEQHDIYSSRGSCNSNNCFVEDKLEVTIEDCYEDEEEFKPQLLKLNSNEKEQQQTRECHSVKLNYDEKDQKEGKSSHIQKQMPIKPQRQVNCTNSSDTNTDSHSDTDNAKKSKSDESSEHDSDEFAHSKYLARLYSYFKGELEKQGTMKEALDMMQSHVINILQNQANTQFDDDTAMGDGTRTSSTVKAASSSRSMQSNDSNLKLVNELIMEYFKWHGFHYSAEMLACETKVSTNTNDTTRSSHEHLLGPTQHKNLPILAEFIAILAAEKKEKEKLEADY